VARSQKLSWLGVGMSNPPCGLAVSQMTPRLSGVFRDALPLKPEIAIRIYIKVFLPKGHYRKLLYFL
jgi:hypothetical protein